jgi:hypothetical protein
MAMTHPFASIISYEIKIFALHLLPLTTVTDLQNWKHTVMVILVRDEVEMDSPDVLARLELYPLQFWLIRFGLHSWLSHDACHDERRGGGG